MATDTAEHFKVAIIGGGIGGAATAYYLRKMFGSQVAITLFEQSGRIGGRIRSLTYGGANVEAGAGVFIWENAYMVKFAKEFDIQLHDRRNDPIGMAFYDGSKQFTYSTLNSSGWLPRTRMALHYGFPFFRLLLNAMGQIYSFAYIYQLQNSGKCFNTPAELLSAIHPEFLKMTQHTYDSWLNKHHGVSGALKDEFLFGLVSMNYCQDLNVHAFAGFLTVATMAGRLRTAKDGLQLIPERLVKSALSSNPGGSPNNFTPAQVTKISSNPDGKYEVQYRHLMTKESDSDTFDYVVIAAPLHQDSSLKTDKSITLPSDTYQEVDRTFLTGDLKESVFGMTMASVKKGRLPMIFSTQTAYSQNRSLFRSLVALPSPTGEQHLWTTFTDPARTPAPERTMAERYLDVSEQDPPLKFNWLAYPIYKPVSDPHKELGSFVLAPRLYYVNAIERVASCMEMSIIGGRNVALLIGTDRKWQPQPMKWF